MKVEIILDVMENAQVGFSPQIAFGDFNRVMPPLSESYKRYKVTVEIPHRLDAEEVKALEVTDVA